MSQTKTSEAQQQEKYFDWVRIKRNQDARYYNITHFANERKCSWSLGKRLKALGVSAGFPDVGIFISQWADRSDVNFYALFLEFKVKPNKQTSEQKDWQVRLEKAGYLYKLIWSADEAIAMTEEYFG